MNIYWLKIECNEGQSDKLSNLLGVGEYDEYSGSWRVEIEEQASGPPVSFIDYFLGILEGHYASISALGIKQSDISIWRLYEYDQQCNVEISSEDMKRLGSRGIVFCMSCWASE